MALWDGFQSGSSNQASAALSSPWHGLSLNQGLHWMPLDATLHLHLSLSQKTLTLMELMQRTEGDAFFSSCSLERKSNSLWKVRGETWQPDAFKALDYFPSMVYIKV